MVHIINLARVLERLIGLHVRGSCPGKRIAHRLRSTDMHLLVIVILCSYRTFLYLLILLLHSCLRIHSKILINVLLLLIDSRLLGQQSHILLRVHPSIHWCRCCVLRMELRLTTIVYNLHRLLRWIVCHAWALRWLYVRWREPLIVISACIGMRVKSQLVSTSRGFNHLRVTVVWSTCLIIGTNLLHGNRHIFGIGFLRDHLLLVHQLVLLMARRSKLALGINFLNLHDILLYFFKVCAFEFFVLVKIRALLTVS